MSFDLRRAPSSFRRWYETLGRFTAFLVDLCAAGVFPVLLERGFEVLDHPGAPHYLGFQQRSRIAWPTVEFRFDKYSRPYFWMYVDFLPKECFRMDPKGLIAIPRDEALVGEGLAEFAIVDKGRWHPHDGYGMPGVLLSLGSMRLGKLTRFALSPKKMLRSEAGTARDHLLESMAWIEQDVPASWAEAAPERLGEYGYLSRSLAQTREAYRAAGFRGV